MIFKDLLPGLRNRNREDDKDVYYHIIENWSPLSTHQQVMQLNKVNLYLVDCSVDIKRSGSFLVVLLWKELLFGAGIWGGIPQFPRLARKAVGIYGNDYPMSLVHQSLLCTHSFFPSFKKYLKRKKIKETEKMRGSNYCSERREIPCTTPRAFICVSTMSPGDLDATGNQPSL